MVIGKSGPGELFPEMATNAEIRRLEPLIGPDEIQQRHVFGIPLVSRMKNPVTGKYQIMTDDTIKDFILDALSQAEQDLKIDISPVERKFKMPYQRLDYEAFGYMSLPYRPISRLIKVSITPANGLSIFDIPLTWVETAYMHRGQINIIPMTAAITGGFVTGGQIPASVYFLTLTGARNWIPAWFQIECISGFPDGMVPRVINDYIGTVAAWEILSQIIPTYMLANSHSLSIDGLSQSVSMNPALLQQRLKDLSDKRERLRGRIRNMFGTGLFVSNV